MTTLVCFAYVLRSFDSTQASTFTSTSTSTTTASCIQSPAHHIRSNNRSRLDQSVSLVQTDRQTDSVSSVLCVQAGLQDSGDTQTQDAHEAPMLVFQDGGGAGEG